jgi:hypothetical protein
MAHSCFTSSPSPLASGEPQVCIRPPLGRSAVVMGERLPSRSWEAALRGSLGRGRNRGRHAVEATRAGSPKTFAGAGYRMCLLPTRCGRGSKRSTVVARKRRNEEKTNTRTGACAEGAPQRKWAGIQSILVTYHAMIRCQGLRDACRGAPPEGARARPLRCVGQLLGIFQWCRADEWGKRTEEPLA